MDINKFTEKAREAVTQAQSIAVGMGHQDIDSEHLALALIRQEQGIVPRILEQMGVQTTALAVAVEEKLRKRPSVSGGGMDPNRISITQRLAKVLGDAENESRRMKDDTSAWTICSPRWPRTRPARRWARSSRNTASAAPASARPWRACAAARG